VKNPTFQIYSVGSESESLDERVERVSVNLVGFWQNPPSRSKVRAPVTYRLTLKDRSARVVTPFLDALQEQEFRFVLSAGESRHTKVDSPLNSTVAAAQRRKPFSTQKKQTRFIQNAVFAIPFPIVF